MQPLLCDVGLFVQLVNVHVSIRKVRKMEWRKPEESQESVVVGKERFVAVNTKRGQDGCRKVSE